MTTFLIILAYILLTRRNIDAHWGQRIKKIINPDQPDRLKCKKRRKMIKLDLEEGLYSFFDTVNM